MLCKAMEERGRPMKAMAHSMVQRSICDYKVRMGNSISSLPSQLDVNLPDRFGLEYAVADGEEDYNPLTTGKPMPVMIQRAVFGSLVRFFALLIEHYGGRWPFWLSPLQEIILTVNQ